MTLLIGGIILFLAVLAVGDYGIRLIAIGTAYKAKMLCSEIFVAGRNPDAVLADLVIDDLAALRFVDATIDTRERKVAASFHGLAKTTVRYRDSVGCALAGDATTPPSGEMDTRGKPSAANDSQIEDIPSTDPSKPGRAVHPRLAAVVDAAFSEPDPEHPRRTRAVVIVHKGHIVAERYGIGIHSNTPLPGWSMAKSVMNALVGTLIREGRLALDRPVLADHWNRPGDARARITVAHLLHMSSGLAFDENMANPLADVSHMLLLEPDMAAFAANKPLEEEPGTRWQYSTGTTNILSAFLRRLLGEEDYRGFPRRALFDPLGMDRAVLETDASGTFVGSSFMYATAREWARFGLLYLHDGVWNNRRLLPEGWVRYSATPAATDPQAAYGAHFWRRIPEEYRGTGNLVPEDALHAAGHEAQFVSIIPSRQTVIVRLGKTRYPQAWKHDVFVHEVLAALSEGE